MRSTKWADGEWKIKSKTEPELDIWLGFGSDPDPVVRPADIFTVVTPERKKERDLASTTDNGRQLATAEWALSPAHFENAAYQCWRCYFETSGTNIINKCIRHINIILLSNKLSTTFLWHIHNNNNEHFQVFLRLEILHPRPSEARETALLVAVWRK